MGIVSKISTYVFTRYNYNTRISIAFPLFPLGLAELEYPLADGTTLGNWKLIVQPESDSVYTEMKMFSVAHYGERSSFNRCV